jgi:hypothetical protein
MSTERIREGFDVFVHDGDKAVGAVRQVHKSEIVVYVENAGDFVVPVDAISDVHSEKVILNCAKLALPLKRAIGHAHAAEDPKI